MAAVTVVASSREAFLPSQLGHRTPDPSPPLRAFRRQHDARPAGVQRRRSQQRRKEDDDARGSARWREEDSHPGGGGGGGDSPFPAGTELLYGRNVVYAALRARRRTAYELLVQDSLRYSGTSAESGGGLVDLLGAAEEADVAVRWCPRVVLNDLTGDRAHQGVALCASPLPLPAIPWLTPQPHDDSGTTQTQTMPLHIVLDQVADVGNLGSICRSAYFFGASSVVLQSSSSARPTPAASKASAGAMELIQLTQTENIGRFLQQSQARGFRLIGAAVSEGETDSEGEKDGGRSDEGRTRVDGGLLPGVSVVGVDEVSWGKLDDSRPVLLVLGNEGSGVRRSVLGCCDTLVEIRGAPLLHRGDGGGGGGGVLLDSLNVGVACGILLHHLHAQWTKRTE
ncbi:unnamed protein product [Vitrella brassicaformis CCMP3155]|uniref:rRNA methyltransferase 1, mitochondrial n=1 Tax=Vitrella brassicaformis (strain CCMP3155) TaxID=1169540 RepID=A0A0G4EQE4_VITBC|nr:unnamed protein product [Vitrella brassicaformis CCMP3155]|eukprot:CEL99654.1 unnamed protein product [Vitrella brassicaformis CCMP3155]